MSDSESTAPERTCWICFMSDSETPKNVRWVHPCKCLGDTKWSHEPCLFTWIIRKQSEKLSQGSGVAVIMHENDFRLPNVDASTGSAVGRAGERISADLFDYIYPFAFHGHHDASEETGMETMEQQIVDAALTLTGTEEGRQYAEVLRSRMETRMQMISNAGEHLIKCPQCGSPYELALKPRPFFHHLFMDLYQLSSGISDYMVPYVVIVGGSFVFLSVTGAFGMFTIVGVCGPEDRIVQHLAAAEWGWREWCGVQSVPYLVGSFRAKLPNSRLSLATSAVIFGFLFGFLPGMNELGLVANYNSPLDLLTSVTAKSVRSLVGWRLQFMTGVLGLKYAYAFIYDSILVPLIVGKPVAIQAALNANSRSTSQSTAATATETDLNADNQYTNYLTEDLIIDPRRQQDNDSMSLFSVGRSVVNAITFPIFASISGNILKSVTESLISSNWLNVADSGAVGLFVKSQLQRSTKFDRFIWTFIGGMTFAFAKDLATLMYNRQRRQQRKNMHVLNYSRS